MIYSVDLSCIDEVRAHNRLFSGCGLFAIVITVHRRVRALIDPGWLLFAYPFC